VQYHLVHSVVLLALAVALMTLPPGTTTTWLRRSAGLMLAGLLLFSGSLYLMALTGIRPLGIITPMGGVSWLIGWGLILLAALKWPAGDNEH